MVNNLSIGTAGIKLIQEFEGFRSEAYISKPDMKWTIGYGNTDTLSDGTPVVQGLVITKERASKEILILARKRYGNHVNEVIKRKIKQNEFDALVSLAWNRGLLTTSLINAVNNNDNQGIVDSFMKVSTSKGQVLKGLVRRRKAELDVYFNGVSQPAPSFDLSNLGGVSSSGGNCYASTTNPVSEVNATASSGGSISASGMLDYFDKKTGKLLGTFENGGQNIEEMKKGGIHIKPENKGKFNATKKRTGKTTEELTHSKNPITKKRAIFAQNAAKWKKGQYGLEVIDEPTFGIGDEGYYERQYTPSLPVNIQNPYQFDPSLTRSLQDYTGNKPMLSPKEQSIYSDYNKKLNQPNLDFVNQLKSQIPNEIPKFSMPTITESKHWAMANERFGKAQDQFVKAGEELVSGFTGGLGGGAGKGAAAGKSAGKALNNFSFFKHGGYLPKMAGGGWMSWANSIAHGASALGYTGGALMESSAAALDTLGTFNINNATRKFEADQFRQFAYDQALNERPYENYGYGTQGRNPAIMEKGGYSIKEMGGNGVPNVEVETNEHIQLPNGYSETIYGNTHAEGGIPLNLQTGSKVFSDKLKEPMTGKKYSKLAKKLETKKDFEALDSKFSDKINKQTAELNIQFKNAELDKLFENQEVNKLSGTFGKKIAQESLVDYGYMKNGGLKKAGNGLS